MIDLRRLQHAVMVAEHRSFVRAAQALHLSQPALSRSIQRLEQQTGLRLFERGRNGVAVTDAGALLVERARGLLAQAEDLERESSILGKGPPGEVRIACGPYPARMVVAPAVGTLLASQPELRFDVRVDQWTKALSLLLERRVDLAVCERSEIADSALEVTPLDRHPAAVAVRAGHPLAGGEGIELREALLWPLVITARLTPRVLKHLLPDVQEQGFSPAVQCEDLGMVKDIVLRSDACAFLPLCVMEDELKAGSLVALDCGAPWLCTEFAIVRRRDRTVSPAAARFMGMAVEFDRDCSRREAELRALYLSGPDRRSAKETAKKRRASVTK